MLKAFFLIFSLTSSQAFAVDLTGLWTGQGAWTVQGSGTDCLMQLQFSQSENVLERQGGYFDCNVVGLKTYPAKWSIQGSELLDMNQKSVGVVADKTVHFTEPYGDEGVVIITDMTVEGLHMDYHEVWMSPEQKVIYDIQGRLFKKEKPDPFNP